MNSAMITRDDFAMLVQILRDYVSAPRSHPSELLCAAERLLRLLTAQQQR